MLRAACPPPGVSEPDASKLLAADNMSVIHDIMSFIRYMEPRVLLSGLVAASLLSWLIVRPRRMTRDERDVQMASLGAHAGHAALITLLLALLLALGFAPGPVTAGLDLFTVANLLMAVLLSSLVVRFAVQLVGYRLAWAGGGRG